MLNQPDASCHRSYSEKGPIGDAIPDSRGQKYTRWWFQHFFTFTPIWGRFPFGLIFSDGLKAPTSMFIFHQQISVFFFDDFHQVSLSWKDRKDSHLNPLLDELRSILAKMEDSFHVNRQPAGCLCQRGWTCPQTAP